MRRMRLAFIKPQLYAVHSVEPWHRHERRSSLAPLTGVATQCFHAVTDRVPLRPDDPGTRSTHHCSDPNPERRLTMVPNCTSPSGSQKTNY